MLYYLGLDVGGTHARLKIADEKGRELTAKEGLGGTMPVLGYEETCRRYRLLIEPALNELGLTPTQCGGLCLGAAGIDSDELRAQYLRFLTEMGFPPCCVTAVNDCELLLSLSDGPCVALVSGTGSIAVGRAKPGSAVVRSGGWSYVIGDEGSAVDLSLCAMRLVLMHWDGRLSCPFLAAAFERDPEVSSPEKLVKWCHGNIAEKDKLARFAPLVEAAAKEGDCAAEALLRASAGKLSDLAVSVANKLGFSEKQFTLLLWGSVLTQNETLREMLIEDLRGHCRQANVCMPGTSALDCAVKLAMKSRADADLRMPGPGATDLA